MSETKAAISKPTITYFGLSGRAAFIKVLFEDAGKPYDFVPVAFDGSHTKLDLPFGQMPILEMPNGFRLAQTGSIVRFVAKQLNQYPSNQEDAARAESIVDQLYDVNGKYYGYTFGQGTEEDTKAYITKQYGYLEAQLAKSESKGEYVLKEFSFADLCLYAFTFELSQFVPLTGLLAAHNARIAARPNIAAYKTSGRQLPPHVKAAPKA